MTEVLPEQMHAPSTEVATRQAQNDFDLDGQDIRLPRLKVGQTQTPAVQDRLVKAGDLFVQRTKDDQEPTVLQENGDLAVGALSDPLVFYVHQVRRGVNFKDPGNPDAKFNDMVLGPWGVSVLEFIQRNPQIDPSGVYRKYDYTITIPGFELLPVAFLMASKWGGSAASDLNTSIQLLRSQGVAIPSIAYRLQIKPVRDGDYGYNKAFVGLAKVAEKDKAEHAELVAQHAAVLPRAVIEHDDESQPSKGFVAEPTERPSVA